MKDDGLRTKEVYRFHIWYFLTTNGSFWKDKFFVEDATFLKQFPRWRNVSHKEYPVPVKNWVDPLQLKNWSREPHFFLAKDVLFFFMFMLFMILICRSEANTSLSFMAPPANIECRLSLILVGSTQKHHNQKMHCNLFFVNWIFPSNLDGFFSRPCSLLLFDVQDVRTSSACWFAMLTLAAQTPFAASLILQDQHPPWTPPRPQTSRLFDLEGAPWLWTFLHPPKSKWPNTWSAETMNVLVFLWAEKHLDKYRYYTCTGHQMTWKAGATWQLNC